jgi:polyhydroxybutyrate depolymerase
MRGWVKGLLIAITCLLVLIAAAIASWRALAPAAPDPPRLAGRFRPGVSEFDRRQRTWLVYEPSRMQRPVPVVFVLPGSAQTAEAIRLFTAYRFEMLAERDGVLLVYAEAWAEGGRWGPEWNDCRKNTALPAHLENVDDVGFIVWLLERLAGEYPIDRQRVYSAGISDGGDMSYRLATERPHLFAAVAAVVAQQAAPQNSNCTNPGGPISVLVMNGTADPVIPYEGGIASFHGISAAGEVQSMAGTLAHWKRVNGMDAGGAGETLEAPDRDPADHSTVRIERFRSASGSRVVAYHVIGGGHAIPGGYRSAPDFVFGPINRDVNGADEIWKFFFGGESGPQPPDR